MISPYEILMRVGLVYMSSDKNLHVNSKYPSYLSLWEKPFYFI